MTKPLRQVASWSSLSSAAVGSPSARNVTSSASSFEKFKQQAREKEERVRLFGGRGRGVCGMIDLYVEWSLNKLTGSSVDTREL